MLKYDPLNFFIDYREEILMFVILYRNPQNHRKQERKQDKKPKQQKRNKTQSYYLSISLSSKLARLSLLSFTFYLFLPISLLPSLLPSFGLFNYTW